jgi:hypothetical protein
LIPDGRTTNAIKRWIFLDHRGIVLRYNAVARGLTNYFSFVDNFSHLKKIVNYFLYHSLAKTLARKFRLDTRAKVFKKFGTGLPPKDELALLTDTLKKKRTKKLPKTVTYALIRTKKTREFITILKIEDAFDVMKWRIDSQIAYIESCLICGNYEKIQTHHIKHLRKDGVTNKNGFAAIISQLNRKQIPVCADCHISIHRGTYDGISLKELHRDTITKITKPLTKKREKISD